MSHKRLTCTKNESHSQKHDPKINSQLSTSFQHKTETRTIPARDARPGGLIRAVTMVYRVESSTFVWCKCTKYWEKQQRQLAELKTQQRLWCSTWYMISKNKNYSPSTHNLMCRKLPFCYFQLHTTTWQCSNKTQLSTTSNKTTLSANYNNYLTTKTSLIFNEYYSRCASLCSRF